MALAAFFEEKGGVSGLLDAVSKSAQEEAVLQALELMTRNQSDVVWLKASELREQVTRLMGQSSEQVGSAQWIGHILKRMHLVDDTRRKRTSGGMIYAIHQVACETRCAAITSMQFQMGRPEKPYIKCRVCHAKSQMYCDLMLSYMATNFG